MNLNPLPVVYADTAIISRMVAGDDGHGKAQGLLAAVEGRQVLLALSFWHLLELNKGLDNTNGAAQVHTDDVLRLLSRLESEKKLRFMAWPDAIWEYELRQKQGVYMANPETWAFVKGPTDLMQMPSTDRELSRDCDLQFFNDILMKDHYASANVQFDERLAALCRDRKWHLDGNGRLPFNEYLKDQVVSRHNGLSSLIPTFNKLRTSEHYRTDFPSLWAYSMMRLALTETRKGDFKVGDVRDMIHIAYLPYVSMLSVDVANFKMIQAFTEMPDDWAQLLIKNGELQNDSWTMPANLRRWCPL